jgi:hypothetical protein
LVAKRYAREAPPPKWFVVDLLENADQATAETEKLRGALEVALREGRFDPDRLASMAARFGSRRTRELVGGAIEATGG